MSTSTLDSADYWRDLAERIGRQLAQTALPIVAVAGLSGTVSLKAVAVPLLVAAAVTLLNSLRKVVVQPGEAVVWQLLDRAVPAAAAVLLGFVPSAGLVSVDWKAAAYAAGAAAVTAVLAYYVTPPASVARAVPDYAQDPDLL